MYSNVDDSFNLKIERIVYILCYHKNTYHTSNNLLQRIVKTYKPEHDL